MTASSLQGQRVTENPKTIPDSDHIHGEYEYFETVYNVFIFLTYAHTV